MPREEILRKVRTALCRSAGETAPDLPAPRIRIPDISIENRIERFTTELSKLAGKPYVAPSRESARDYVANLIGAKPAVASNASLLRECAITTLPAVTSGLTDREQLRGACASAAFGITSADYALADTGTLVMLSSPEEARLVSLLPPVHVAVVPRAKILTGLDELFSLVPQPARDTSSMVLITGPSRTADIEQILVRGVHGPGRLSVVVVG